MGKESDRSGKSCPTPSARSSTAFFFCEPMIDHIGPGLLGKLTSEEQAKIIVVPATTASSCSILEPSQQEELNQ
ncbi:hypothetical protein [Mesorhizobium sp. WSM2239]|uniref:Uncharacterized protein n=2 Tax=unclassified Mesorhizobium TaxID=325217 RepID=A0AAU8DJK3_9HYPH